MKKINDKAVDLIVTVGAIFGVTVILFQILSYTIEGILKLFK